MLSICALARPKVMTLLLLWQLASGSKLMNYLSFTVFRGYVSALLLFVAFKISCSSHSVACCAVILGVARFVSKKEKNGAPFFFLRGRRAEGAGLALGWKASACRRPLCAGPIRRRGLFSLAVASNPMLPVRQRRRNPR